MSTQKTVNVTVVVDDAHRRDMPKVAKALEKQGFILEESLDAIGVLSGRVQKAAVTKLSNVAGVSAVEEARDDYRTEG